MLCAACTPATDCCPQLEISNPSISDFILTGNYFIGTDATTGWFRPGTNHRIQSNAGFASGSVEQNGNVTQSGAFWVSLGDFQANLFNAGATGIQVSAQETLIINSMGMPPRAITFTLKCLGTESPTKSKLLDKPFFL